ncbi:hypothetical protein PFISCL1PPCAC_16725, partial [Pristionchus fissidentatus]
VLDTTTMEILSLKLPKTLNDSTRYSYYMVVDVHGGEIDVCRRMNTEDTWIGTNEICKTKFPEALKNFAEAALARDIQERGEEEKIKREEDVDQNMNSLIEKINRIQLRVDELER